MGKQLIKTYDQHELSCENQDAPICGNETCSKRSNIIDEGKKLKIKKTLSCSTSKLREDSNVRKIDESSIQELFIVGAGPHALTLLLRLLEPDPDFLTDKVRHIHAESPKLMRPFREVYRHIKDIARGPNATLKPKKKKGSKKKHSQNGMIGKNKESLVPPPLTLNTVLNSVQVVDNNGDWLASWKNNFEAIGITKLRSLMNAHADPFDHRSLEYYAESYGRGEELITLPHLTQRDQKFKGPYQVPSTKLFHDFHDALVKSYGIKGIVQKGKVVSIRPMMDPLSNNENLFEIKINQDEEIRTVMTRRCVCALGPSFSDHQFFWEKDLENKHPEKYPQISKKIMRSDGIVQWLLQNDENKTICEGDGNRFLIVGGGITSSQLVFRLLKHSLCQSVIFIQRSESLSRHFDVKNEWMGPHRGKILDEFFSKNMKERSKVLKEARKGGSLPPELLETLRREERKNSNLYCKEGVEIDQIDWDDNEFQVSLNDGSTAEVDYIWLATGCENVIERFSVLNHLRDVLPIKVVNGLPVLSKDLSWASPSSSTTSDDDWKNECKWKVLARKRLWCMGSIAGLQLGADALNIVGARHGAVKIAKAIRDDMHVSEA